VQADPVHVATLIVDPVANQARVAPTGLAAAHDLNSLRDSHLLIVVEPDRPTPLPPLTKGRLALDPAAGPSSRRPQAASFDAELLLAEEPLVAV
jgi:hypothetical protein